MRIIKHTVIAKIKVIQLTDAERLQLEDDFRNGKSHAYRMRCLVILLKSKGLNIFGMVDRNNLHDGFSTNESITADKVTDFLDRLSLRIKKKTFVVLDNASVH